MDALGEEGVTVPGLLSYHLVQLAVELERDDAEQVRPHHKRALDERGLDAGRRDGRLCCSCGKPRETEYQFRADFVVDSSAAQATFGLKPTPWEEIVAATVRPGAASVKKR